MYKTKTTMSSPAAVSMQKTRLHFLILFLVLSSLCLMLRLAYLQFAQYGRFATLSLKNQMSITPLAPTRGIIVDRNGVMLAENIPVYALEVLPERVNDLPKTLTKLKDLLPSVTEEDIERFYETRKQTRRHVPVPFKLKLSEEEVALFATHQYELPGVQIKAELMRYYPLGEITAHLLGYVGRLSPEDIKRIDNNNYQATTFIGKTGIERYYEDDLHGSIGFQQIETDATGRAIRTISKQAPISGQKLSLTLDARLQTRIHHALYGKLGAVAVIDVTNGDILALVSTPSYDPNHFVRGMDPKSYRKLVNAPNKPLYHRAVRGLYPPASTIKPFIALAGLENGMVDEHTTINDPGWYRLPGISHTYRDWKRQGHGAVQLKQALAVSCDTYFYTLGNKLGILEMESILSKFGFGQFTNVDLKEEAQGILPSPRWKKDVRGQSWYPGDTIITAIGQGFMLVTPLQLANATASLSQHGRHFRPHLLKSMVSDEGEVHNFKPLEEYPINLKEHTWNLIAEGMKGVITRRDGTGHRFGRDAGYSVAAKTGTAQVISLSQDEKERTRMLKEDKHAHKDHSLFIAFAPVDKPEIAIAVLLEHDPYASLVARQVMDAYFELKNFDKATS